MRKKINIPMTVCLVTGILTLGACAEYLDVKPIRSLAIPGTLRDLQAILDNETRRNTLYPYAGDVAADYYYLDEAGFNQLNDAFDARNIYLWKSDAVADRDWSNMYLNIFDVNVVLEEVDDAQLGGLTELDRRHIKGAALFFRGLAFYHLAQIFAPPFDEAGAEKLLGVPLRLSPNIETPTTRPSLAETYNQILHDLTEAVALLPTSTPVPVRPNKAAAHAALAKAYLIMGNYQNSLEHANACLDLYSELIDFNDLDPAAAKPVPALNKEVLLHLQMPNGGGGFNNTRAKVSPALHALYTADDLRTEIFYKENADGSYRFTGDYGTSATVTAPFCGLATNEVYLIKAECLARLGEIGLALETLNTLLKNRWKAGLFNPYDTDDAEEALKVIITEREKELALRGGVRWSDLRRLNKDSRFKRTVTREMGGTTYTLQPEDSRYTFLIPASVVQETGIPQNER
ncbi:RagB/SusD family nutrient uptake outer membrane protein [Parapedobacter sp. ISTM3]|uniref:RagB/SusD family nutrient uptake outer membrane protein n=1 Tax=Parapedobacter sp. ISTM3 TaxID=2800130 RepID=UPI0019070D1D|nr:RagB/SusD family nutrient uptake outer membrane protein [Parapedobacter sp. ISTM3]MBK1440742.1 RagB/SusD family nutrient uptake outer membrane protein [Parapedobacter sp. ISTM3]